MCFNAESSMAIYLLCMASSAFVFYKKGYLSSLGILLIGNMQLVDFFIWSDQACGKMNRNASYSVIWLLWFQAVVIMTAAWLRKGRQVSLLCQCTAILIGIVITLVAGFWTHKCNENPGRLCSLQDTKSDRLAWKPVDILFQTPALAAAAGVTYCGAWVIASYMGDYTDHSMPVWQGAVLLFIALGSAFLFNKDNAVAIFGAFWCTLGAILCILASIYWAVRPMCGRAGVPPAGAELPDAGLLPHKRMTVNHDDERYTSTQHYKVKV